MKFLVRRKLTETGHPVEGGEVVFATDCPEDLLRWAREQDLVALGSTPNSGSRVLFLCKQGGLLPLYVVEEPPRQKYLVREKNDDQVIYVAECLAHLLSRMQGREHSPRDFTVELVPWEGE